MGKLPVLTLGLLFLLLFGCTSNTITTILPHSGENVTLDVVNNTVSQSPNRQQIVAIRNDSGRKIEYEYTFSIGYTSEGTTLIVIHYTDAQMEYEARTIAPYGKPPTREYHCIRGPCSLGSGWVEKPPFNESSGQPLDNSTYAPTPARNQSSPAPEQPAPPPANRTTELPNSSTANQSQPKIPAPERFVPGEKLDKFANWTGKMLALPDGHRLRIDDIRYTDSEQRILFNVTIFNADGTPSSDAPFVPIYAKDQYGGRYNYWSNDKNYTLVLRNQTVGETCLTGYEPPENSTLWKWISPTVIYYNNSGAWTWFDGDLYERNSFGQTDDPMLQPGGPLPWGFNSSYEGYAYAGWFLKPIMHIADYSAMKGKVRLQVLTPNQTIIRDVVLDNPHPDLEFLVPGEEKVVDLRLCSITPGFPGYNGHSGYLITERPVDPRRAQ